MIGTPSEPTESMTQGSNPKGPSEKTKKPNARKQLGKTTGYRALRLLDWLEVHPLSRADINNKLQTLNPPSPPLSEDAIGLYINTLKAIGCIIERPSTKNQFCFVLRHNPLRTTFSDSFTNEHLEAFAALKLVAPKYIDVQGILDLDALLKGYLQWALPTEVASVMTKKLFELTRSIDYSSQLERIALANQAIENQSLLQFDYVSTQNGLKPHTLLPTRLEYQRGSLYLCGLETLYPDQSRYRFEHIRTLATVSQPTTLSQLLPRFQTPQQFRFHLPQMNNPSPLLWGLGETMQAARRVLEPNAPGYVVDVTTHDTFTLHQQLLAMGITFHVLKPDWFKAQLLESLSLTLQQYDMEHAETTSEQQQPEQSNYITPISSPTITNP